MTSKFNKKQAKQHYLKAIEMRDTVVKRVNHKTNEIENLRYSRSHIKEVKNLKAYEAKKLNIYAKDTRHIKTKLQRKAESYLNKRKESKRTPRRIKEQ